MIPATTKRLILNPAPLVGEAIGERTHNEMAGHSAAATGILEQRRRKLDCEWDVGRLTAATYGLLLLPALGLVALRGEQWLVFPAVVAACLLLHALVGWSPALPLMRGLGFRTSLEIARERLALESVRGDAQTASRTMAVQDREDLSRFENEGGSSVTRSAALVSGGAVSDAKTGKTGR